MFGQRAAELIRELERASDDALPPYKAESVRGICEEMQGIFEANCRDRVNLDADGIEQATAVKIQHAMHFRDTAMSRNKRCLIAYHYNRMERLRNLRWSLGGIIPTAIRQTLSEKETEWFSNYSKALTNYMMDVAELPDQDPADPQDPVVLDLTVHQRPPKEYFIDVKVLVDYGNYETQDGETIFLKKHMRLCMARTECEHLIRQGILQHVQ
ncbi:putative DNA replication complex GINS protein PSF1 [Hypsibius exemplaris]|uniref:DNA replication complex GINS protein PSF1 n=1 Tax=Hypsibius exemplaris TaxID=2072580 RepID=A0A1W0WN03_HYPEX|nr:putative DNA replication complex GINS protein PSF1 [Hypsibius exemplaris]